MGTQEDEQMHSAYISKANRDAAFTKHGGRKGTISNQNLHPMYVVDYEQETGVILTDADKGFGNTIYRTFFPKLYTLD